MENAAAQYEQPLFKHFKLIIQWIDSLFEIIAFEGGILLFFRKKLKICAIFIEVLFSMIMDNFDSPFLYNRPSLDVEGVKKQLFIN